MMSFVLTGIAAFLLSIVLVVTSFFGRTIDFIRTLNDVEVVYCDDEVTGAMTGLCSEELLDLIPFTAAEILELRYPFSDDRVIVFEDASRVYVLDHLAGLGYEQMPGEASGWVELPDFLRDELNLKSDDPNEFTWEVILFSDGIVVGFIESEIELERIILYIP